MTTNSEIHSSPDTPNVYLAALARPDFTALVTQYREDFRYTSDLDPLLIDRLNRRRAALSKALGVDSLRQAVVISTVGYSYDPTAHVASPEPTMLVDQWAHFKGADVADVGGDVQPVLHFITPSSDGVRPDHYVTHTSPEVFAQFEQFSSVRHRHTAETDPLQRLYRYSVAARSEMETDWGDNPLERDRKLRLLRKQIDFELQRWFDINPNQPITCTAMECVSYTHGAERVLTHVGLPDQGMEVSGIKRPTEIVGTRYSSPIITDMVELAGKPLGTAYLHLVGTAGLRLWIPVEQVTGFQEAA